MSGALRWLCTLVALLWCGSAFAQSSGDEAVALGKQGVELYNEQRWVEAYDRFALAERTHHSPVFLLYMGRCKLQLDDLLKAREHFAAVVAEDVSSAPDPWQRAHKEAKAEHAAVEKDIPTLRVTVEGAPSATITIDGAPRDGTAPIAVNPGTRMVEGRAGDLVATETVIVAKGEKNKPVTLTLTPGTEPLPISPSPHPPTPATEGTYLPGALVLAASGAALIVGAITGALALGKTNEIKEGCIEDSCLLSDEEKGDEANALATTSTVTLIAGGVLAAAGITLLIVLGPSDEAEVALSPTALMISGAF